MTDLNLPAELVEFLSAGRKLQYDASSVEPGAVGLKALHELELGVVWIHSDESPLKEDDPHAGEDGYYEVPAVDLTAECEAYDPAYILLWLPKEELFGSWDCDHMDLYVFPGKSWSDIVADPALYLDASWNDYQRNVSEYFKPYPKYEFKPGFPC